MNAAELIRSLGLTPHPEGGWYRELHRSAVQVTAPQGRRTALTTIYYLLEHGQQSRWHVVASDEAWHFYAGEPLALLDYDPGSGRLLKHVLGSPGEQLPKGVSLGAAAAWAATTRVVPVAVIPAGHWQAAWPLGSHALVGCSVGPGFEFGDFRFVADGADHQRHFSQDMSGFTGLL